MDFPDGLVVVWADNSMGKSTCVKAILVALGMEAMLTTTLADLPLPPAVKIRLASSTGEHEVIESEVFLEIENDRAERIVVHRVIKGKRDKNLITVHEGPVLTKPGAACLTKDFFVSRQGSATREMGFHHYLAKFLQWKLPEVQTFDGNEYPLYLQCIFPYFVVEQTRGWSMVQPPLPTHFKIRDIHKRVIEFLLNLDAHQLAIKRGEVLSKIAKIELEWSIQVNRVSDLAVGVAASIQALPSKPVATWPPQVMPSLMVPSGDEWISFEQRLKKNQSEIDRLAQQEIPRVQEIASAAQSELAVAEKQVVERQSILSRLLDSLEMEEQEIKRIAERLRVIDEDIQRNKDVRTLRQLGSRQNSAVDNGVCPICHQSIHDSLIPLGPNQGVMSLDENIQFLSEQRRTYDAGLTNARRVVESRTNQVRIQRENLDSLREVVRTLRQTLMADGRLPSMSAIRARIELEHSVKKDNDVQEQFFRISGAFEKLSKQWLSVQEELQKLPKDDVTVPDKQKIELWTNSMRDQLSQYGFGSLTVNQVVISPHTYRAEHSGFDLQTSLPLQTSISASDLIRTIWAYLSGLLELSRTQDVNHPGCLIFDEPKQQSTRDMSFGALLRRASSAGKFGQQIIFFTSENLERLETHLSGLDHTIEIIKGRVLKKL
jgi:hypothetical protein